MWRKWEERFISNNYRSKDWLTWKAFHVGGTFTAARPRTVSWAADTLLLPHHRQTLKNRLWNRDNFSHPGRVHVGVGNDRFCGVPLGPTKPRPPTHQKRQKYLNIFWLIFWTKRVCHCIIQGILPNATDSRGRIEKTGTPMAGIRAKHSRPHPHIGPLDLVDPLKVPVLPVAFDGRCDFHIGPDFNRTKRKLLK